MTACKTELASLNANREGILRRAADLRQLAEDLSGDREQKEAALKRYQEQIETAQASMASPTATSTSESRFICASSILLQNRKGLSALIFACG